MYKIEAHLEYTKINRISAVLNCYLMGVDNYENIPKKAPLRECD
jgi:hypothetical protein